MCSIRFSQLHHFYIFNSHGFAFSFTNALLVLPQSAYRNFNSSCPFYRYLCLEKVDYSTRCPQNHSVSTDRTTNGNSSERRLLLERFSNGFYTFQLSQWGVTPTCKRSPSSLSEPKAHTRKIEKERREWTFALSILQFCTNWLLFTVNCVFESILLNFRLFIEFIF